MDILKHYGFVVGSNSIITQRDNVVDNDFIENSSNNDDEQFNNRRNNAQTSEHNSGLENDTSSTSSSSPLSNRTEPVIVHISSTSTS